MLTSPQARRAFQVDQEPAWLRDRYGRNEYGESFLLARRLIEAEVRLVSVIWLYVSPAGVVSNVWDTHGGGGIPHGATGWSMLLAPYCLPPLDPALSHLRWPRCDGDFLASMDRPCQQRLAPSATSLPDQQRRQQCEPCQGQPAGKDQDEQQPGEPAARAVIGRGTGGRRFRRLLEA